MQHAFSKLIYLFALAACVLGCRNPDKLPSGEGLLNPPRIAADSSDLDVFFITLPEQAAEETFEAVWRQADAQQIAANIRQTHYQNGIRAAVLGWRLPPALQAMIEQQSQPLTLDQKAPAPLRPDNMMTPFDLDKMDRVSIRRIVARPNNRSEIIISRAFKEFPLLLVKDGEISGGNYQDAQGVFGIRAVPVSGGKVRVEVDPELQYGERIQNANTTAAGIYKLTHTKQKVAFEEMAFACDLTPGEFLVIGTQPGRPGSVGDRFFEDKSSGESRRKLLLIRLARAPGSELFGGLPSTATAGR